MGVQFTTMKTVIEYGLLIAAIVAVLSLPVDALSGATLALALILHLFVLVLAARTFWTALNELAKELE